MYAESNTEALSRIIVAVENQKVLHICVRVPGSVACMHVALLTQHATRMRHIVTSFFARLSPPDF
jgi:hypothetical protein